MSLPDFTPDEQYLVDFVKSPAASQSAIVYMWAYVVSGAALCFFGVYHDSIELIVAAFIVVIGFRLYEDRYHKRWLPLWRRVIEKYEAAIMEADAKAFGAVSAEGRQGPLQ